MITLEPLGKLVSALEVTEGETNTGALKTQVSAMRENEVPTYKLIIKKVKTF